MFYRKRNKKGFSLIELIVVVAIMAILGAVVGVTVATQVAKSKHQAVQSNVDAVKDAMRTSLEGVKVSWGTTAGTGANAIKGIKFALGTAGGKYYAAGANNTYTETALTANGVNLAGAATGAIATPYFDFALSATMDGNPVQFLKNNGISIVYVPEGKTLPAAGIPDAYTGGTAYYVTGGARALYTATDAVFIISDSTGAERNDAFINSWVIKVSDYMNMGTI